MNEDLKSFLNRMQEMVENVDVYAPSLDKKITSKQLSFKQQKNLLSTIAEGAVGILKFQKTINDIIIENTGNEDLLVTDKLPIILKLRMDSIGNDLKFGDDVVDITENLSIAEKMVFPKITPIKGELVVTMKIPTLKEESQIISVAMDFLKKDGEKEAGKAIGNMYVFEIVKFIEKIKIQDTELVFSDLPVKDRLKVVESMPLSVNTKIVEFIESIKKIENDSLEVVVDGDKKRIDIDVSFFDN
jgi:hypothetical protein